MIVLHLEETASKTVIENEPGQITYCHVRHGGMAAPVVMSRTKRSCFFSLISLTTSADSTPAKKRITPGIERAISG